MKYIVFLKSETSPIEVEEHEDVQEARETGDAFDLRYALIEGQKAAIQNIPGRDELLEYLKDELLFESAGKVLPTIIIDKPNEEQLERIKSFSCVHQVTEDGQMELIAPVDDVRHDLN